MERALKETRLPSFPIGADRNAGEGNSLLADLDQRLDRVAEWRDYIQLHRRISRDGAEAAYRVRYVDAGKRTNDPAAETLQQLLVRRSTAVAHDHVRAPLENRSHELLDVGTAILIIRVGVDDDVR